MLFKSPHLIPRLSLLSSVFIDLSGGLLSPVLVKLQSKHVPGGIRWGRGSFGAGGFTRTSRSDLFRGVKHDCYHVLLGFGVGIAEIGISCIIQNIIPTITIKSTSHVF